MEDLNTGDDLKTQIGLRLKGLRLDYKLSLQELGAEIGATKNQIGNWEQGIRTISIDYLLRIAKRFNVTIDWLAFNSDQAAADNAKTYVIEDDLMLPDIKKGDVVSVDTSLNSPISSGIYAINCNGNVQVRWIRAKLVGGGFTVSEGSNSTSPETITTFDSLEELEALCLLGRVKAIKRSI